MVFLRNSVRAGVVLALGFALLALNMPLSAQARGAKIEVKGMPAQIDRGAGTFKIESLTIKTTPATRYEDRNDRHTDKAAFFSDLHESDRVEVDGNLDGSTIVASKVEIDNH